MNSYRTLILFNLGLAALFALSIGTMGPLMLSSGDTLLARLSDSVSVVSDAFTAAPRAFVASSLIPLMAGLVCGAGCIIAARRIQPKVVFRLNVLVLIVVALLSAIAAILQKGLPVLSLALVPLAYGTYSAWRQVRF